MRRDILPDDATLRQLALAHNRRGTRSGLRAVADLQDQLAAATRTLMPIPNHLSVVVEARRRYDGFTGRERAYRICNAVAWALRAEGAGLFFKPSGDGFNARSSDVIMFHPGGETVDVLGDAEGAAVPQWRRTTPTGLGDLAKWRAPVDPVTLSPGPVPAPGPPAPPPDSTLEARVIALARQLEALQEAVSLLQLTHYRIIGVVGSTWGHSHPLTVTLERTP